MDGTRKGVIILLSATLFTFLFYKQALGINLVIYESAVLAWFFYTKEIRPKDPLQGLSLLSILSSLVFTVLYHSTLSFVVNFLSFFTLIGILSAPQIRSLVYSLQNSFTSLFVSQVRFRKQFKEEGDRKRFIAFRFRFLRLIIIPLLIIILFIGIYSASNVKFADGVGEINSFLYKYFNKFFEYIEIGALLTILLGILIGNFLFIREENKQAVASDIHSDDRLFRIRAKKAFKPHILGLLNEYRSAVFLFISLNLLLGILNALDVYWVWFHFEWSGQFLRDFVHSGTYMLLISIVISIGLVLYFFRSNLNFFSRNTLLRKLSYLWIGQNLLLAFSVGIRNWYYIQYYALAYKRIAIFFFLILAAFALITVIIKVRDIKSTYYLIRVNSLSLLLVLLLSSALNWDRIIARYNFSKSDHSFVHLDFLATLSDNSLPWLDHPIHKLKDVDLHQMDLFHFSSSGSDFYRRVYMDPQTYYKRIAARKERFRRKWEQKGFLSWNYAEYQAYHLMFD